MQRCCRGCVVPCQIDVGNLQARKSRCCLQRNKAYPFRDPDTAGCLSMKSVANKSIRAVHCWQYMPKHGSL